MNHYENWNPLFWDILPNYRLIRSRRTDTDNGLTDNTFGLLNRNDEIIASWIYTGDLFYNPLYDLNFDSESPSVAFLKKFYPHVEDSILEEWIQLQEVWVQIITPLVDNFPNMKLSDSHTLVEDLKQAGYDPEIHSNEPLAFLFNLIANILSWNSGYYDININQKYLDFGE